VIGVIHTQIVSLGMLWCKVDILATQKPSVVSNPRWVLLRAGGPVARRRSFLFNKQGEHTKPASREACCRAAVKPRPSSMSVERPPRPMDAMWGQGALPLVRAMRPVAEWRSFLFNKQGNHTRPASREACRRAAVKPRPNRISLYAHGAQSGGAGGHPLLYGEGFVLAEESGVFGEKGTDEGGKKLVHLLGTAARVESRIK